MLHLKSNSNHSYLKQMGVKLRRGSRRSSRSAEKAVQKKLFLKMRKDATSTAAMKKPDRMTTHLHLVRSPTALFLCSAALANREGTTQQAVEEVGSRQQS